jgi:hypothetical protein
MQQQRERVRLLLLGSARVPAIGWSLQAPRLLCDPFTNRSDLGCDMHYHGHISNILMFLMLNISTSTTPLVSCACLWVHGSTTYRRTSPLGALPCGRPHRTHNNTTYFPSAPLTWNMESPLLQLPGEIRNQSMYLDLERAQCFSGISPKSLPPENVLTLNLTFSI